jgi:phosphate transport system substrate-binding protein
MRRALRALLPVMAVLGLLQLVAPPALANPARINGSGSTYVALAMQQWVADAQTSGLQVNYLPTGSPTGLTQFGQGLIDFAGTEAEYSALGNAGGADQRGYQYVPDVAGAVAVMYNVEDKAQRKVDYLHLSRETIARIFIGDITTWADPAITADNKGLELPAEPILVVYRGGQSGTTALFYDFVQHIIPDKFAAWAARNELPTNVRIIQLDSAPTFAPKTTALNGSDQIAQFVASSQGKWAIAYDEFGYAKTYHAPAAWVQNQSGSWVLPYAQNISAALEAAQLRPDLSQELAGVYASTNPEAYPISAYSYMVTQCTQDAARPTCRGAYTNGGVSETLARWLRYIACEGQVNMARIGYSPLPANLSQEIANSIARMQGTGAEQLTAGNCANPRFSGSLGEGASSPKDPLADVVDHGLGGGGGGGDSPSSGNGDGSPVASAAGSASATETAAGATSATGSAGRAGGASAVGGGSTHWRKAAPVAYDRPAPSGSWTALPVILLLAAIAIPALAFGRGAARAA